MNISSRTPEGQPNHCPICGKWVSIEPSEPAGDAPCPHCGTLLWFRSTNRQIWFYEAKELTPIFEKVKRILAKYLGVPEKEITLATALRRPTASFSAEIGMDSLDLVELLMELEEESSVFPDADAEGIDTALDLCVWILRHQADA